MQALSLVFNANLAQADLALNAGSLGGNDWLRTVVHTSLFTNRRDPITGQAGYWGDYFSGESYGSLLYTLAREKLHRPTLQRARDYARSALQWLIDGGYVTAISVQTEALSAIRMRLQIVLTLPNGQTTEQNEEFDLAA